MKSQTRYRGIATFDFNSFAPDAKGRRAWIQPRGNEPLRRESREFGDGGVALADRSYTAAEEGG